MLRIIGHDRNQTGAEVVHEFPLTVILNDHELATLLCSPTDLKYLAIGFLYSEGFIRGKDEILWTRIDEERGVANIATRHSAEPERRFLFENMISAACGRGAAFNSAGSDPYLQRKVESQTRVSPDEVFSLVEAFNQHSRLFKVTGGVHGAALSDGKSILVFSDDLGRHNAIDKVLGKCLIEGITTEGRIVITSGRAPSGMIFKAANGKVPIMISVGAPTTLGVRLAHDIGITLIGFVRGKDMTVYTHDWRITG